MQRLLLGLLVSCSLFAQPTISLRMKNGDQYFKVALFTDFKGGGWWDLNWRDNGEGWQIAALKTPLREIVLVSNAAIATQSGHLYLYAAHLTPDPQGNSALTLDPAAMSQVRRVEIWDAQGKLPAVNDVVLRLVHQHSAGYGTLSLANLPRAFLLAATGVPANFSAYLSSWRETPEGLEVAQRTVPLNQGSGSVILGKAGYADLALPAPDAQTDVSSHVSLYDSLFIGSSEAVAFNAPRVRIALSTDANRLHVNLRSGFARKPLQCGADRLQCFYDTIHKRYWESQFQVGPDGSLSVERSRHVSLFSPVTFPTGIPLTDTIAREDRLIPSDRAVLIAGNFVENAAQASDGAFHLVGVDDFKYQLDRWDGQQWVNVPLQAQSPASGKKLADSLKRLEAKGLVSGDKYRFLRRYQHESGFRSRSELSFTATSTALLPSLHELNIRLAGDGLNFQLGFNNEEMPHFQCPMTALTEVTLQYRRPHGSWTSVPVQADPALPNYFQAIGPVPSATKLDVQVTGKDRFGNVRTTTLNDYPL